MAVTKVAIKGTAIETPAHDPNTHFPVLVQLKEVVEIGQRLRGDPNDSFVRVSELVKLNLARLVNGTLQPATVVFTVGTLPAGAPGKRAFVNDALAPVFGAAVAAGGAVTVPVYHTGNAWFVG